jgi:hypothetical protein
MNDPTMVVTFANVVLLRVPRSKGHVDVVAAAPNGDGSTMWSSHNA